MVGEAIAGLSIFNSMLDMAKGLKNINDAAIRNMAVVDLTEKIIAAQAEQNALVAKVGKLEKELMRFETWEAEKQRYELYEIKPGRLTRRLKATMSDGEISHDICAQCYNKGVKGILQKSVTEHGRYTMLTCAECHTALNLSLAV
ncbi:hypothetical protein MOV61_25205 [Neorhizobium sp. BETTINA12A]|uniref:hypothetical protein n=1 Tax=Neorhizobium sp. BETTINA12A TaxID=2908924 RepID=UPI001FF54F12|nr:hypothetical protein [Neorhizobium sp. BETTINA12A]MCJ9754028.1 hypothetical protein [Neorhizobium sp. BETTINA12A]